MGDVAFEYVAEQCCRGLGQRLLQLSHRFELRRRARPVDPAFVSSQTRPLTPGDEKAAERRTAQADWRAWHVVTLATTPDTNVCAAPGSEKLAIVSLTPNCAGSFAPCGIR